MLPSEFLAKGWYPHEWAATRYGMRVQPDDEAAVLFSIDGAVEASFRDYTITVEQRARMYYAIRAVVGRGDVGFWERNPSVTQDVVVAVVKKAEDFVMSLQTLKDGQYVA